jgi:uncharacterized protein (DUF1800 family)
VVVGPFENEAIRPRVFGRFEDLLIASSAHPAMLSYLDQYQSIGPDSPAAQFLAKRQGRKSGLNENLAREILELHTVGVDSGYSQADVTEFARALTGWSIGGPREPADRQGAFLFRANAHEPGTRTIMGRTYRQDGVDQAMAVMRDLAASPATARHVCGKIARHFVADDPPPALTQRLVDTWLGSGGDLSAVALALVTAQEAWDPAAAKFKSPYEFLISSWRAIGGQPTSIEYFAPLITSMGQKPFSAPSPKGWPDDDSAWAAPSGLIERADWATQMTSAAAGTRDINGLAADVLGPTAAPATLEAIARAESRPQALALLVTSSEFQTR